MKAYQVKLRMVGILSLVLAVLAAMIPLPSKAAGIAALTDIRNKFTHIVEQDTIDTSLYTVWLTRYLNSSAAEDETWTIPAQFSNGSNTYRVRFASDSVFLNCDNLKEITIEKEVLSELTSAREMFKGCTSLTTVTITDNTTADTNSLTSMESMFEGCSADNVTTMKRMFASCTSLTSFTASGWSGNLASVTTMEGMFEGCTALTEADFSNHMLENLTDVTRMFYGNKLLEKLDLRDAAFNRIGSKDTTEGMLADCDSLTTIMIPKGLPSASPIFFPHDYSYKDASGTKYDRMPASRMSSFEINRIDDVTGITLTPDNAAEAQELKEGQSTNLTLTLSPRFAQNKGVKIESGNANAATVSPASGTVDHDGNLTVTVTGVKATVDGNGNPQPTTVTITATSDEDSTITDTCDITVVAEVVDVTGIMITSEADQTTPLPAELPDSIKIGETLTLAAPVTPNSNTLSATNHHVTWESDNTAVVTVTNTTTGENSATGTDKDTPSKTTITGVKPGTAYITATSNNGGKTARVKVTVESQYDIYTNTTLEKSADATTDDRSDCNNKKYTTVTAATLPVAGDLLLQVKTPASPLMATQMAATGNFNSLSYFELEITDTAGNPVNVDLGDIVITMALPGSMQPPNSTGQQLFLYSYNPNATNPNNLATSIVERTSFDNGRVDAIRFRIDSASLAQEYALAMNIDTTVPFTQHTLAARDQRNVSQYQGPAHVNRTPNTVQTTDMYLFVNEITGSTPDPALKTVVDSDSALSAYQTKHYYDIFLASDEAGQNKITYDFKELEVYISLPTGLDVNNGNYRLIREKVGGGWEDAPGVRKVIGLDNGHHYMAFKADHFSEYALLYSLSDGTSNTTVNTQPVINVNIPTINVNIEGINIPVNEGTTNTGGTQTNDQNANPNQNPQQANVNQSTSYRTDNTTGTGVYPYNNAGDMPTTGGAHMYRVLIVMLLGMSGFVEVMLSIPARRRLHIT